MIRVIWTLIGMNSIALLVFITYFFVVTHGRHVDSMEAGWTTILCSAALVIILLAALPLRFGNSTFSVVFAGIFALLPLFIAGWFFFSKKISSLKKEPTYARVFFSDPTQRAIAWAIETGDTAQLRLLVPGKDLAVRGTKVWDSAGLNYLQFAIHIRSNPTDFPFDEAAGDESIRILLENGSPVTPALELATRYLSPALVETMLKAGADASVKTEVGGYSLLFDVIGHDKKKNDIAILLVKYGAEINSVNTNGYTPIMQAADNSEVSTRWDDTWRVVRFILETGKADYTRPASDGRSFRSIVDDKQREAEKKGINLSPDFKGILLFLDQSPG